LKAALANYGKIADEFSKVSGRKYDLLETYRTDDAENIIVLAGSTAGTAKEAVDRLREKGKKVGLLKIKLFRPFPSEEVKNAISCAKNIAVLDRAMSFGTYPPLYQEVLSSMYNVSSIKNENIHDTKYIIHSYIYGLGGRDIFVKDIEQVFVDLEKGNISEEIKYIGLAKND
jgi:pyruvate ferredoxin oxidoreductase alpha subunit